MLLVSKCECVLRAQRPGYFSLGGDERLSRFPAPTGASSNLCLTGCAAGGRGNEYRFRIRTPKGEPCRWQDYKAVNLHGQVREAFFHEHDQLSWLGE